MVFSSIEQKSLYISLITTNMEEKKTTEDSVELKDMNEKSEKPTETDGNLVNHDLHIEKIVPHESYDLIIPDFMENPPEANAEKETSTDAPDGFNVYRNKKTLTQGMMDVALFSANVSQLRSILSQLDHSNNPNNVYCYILIIMLLISLFLQIGVGLILLLSTRFNVNNAEERRMAYEYGNYVVAGIFLVTVVNIFISAFGSPEDKSGS